MAAAAGGGACRHLPALINALDRAKDVPARALLLAALVPSQQHEGLLELFRARRTLAAELMQSVCAVPLPEATGAEILSASFTDVRPPEYTADLVLLVKAGQRRYVTVLEVQLGSSARKRREKQRAWPRYVASLWSDTGLPVYLVVVTRSASVERWAGEPIQLGHPGFTLAPIVLGPSNVPRVLDRDRALSCPELAVLSAVVHGRAAKWTAAGIGKLAVEAALATGDEERRLYTDMVLDALGKPARREVELMMTQSYQYQSELFRKLVQQGREEGLEQGLEQALARDVLDVLEARGFRVSKKTAARVRACSDMETLRAWLRRAATLERIQDIFA